MQTARRTQTGYGALAALRTELSKKFGAAAAGIAGVPEQSPHPPPLPTGIPSWDAAGGLQRGQITEACGGSADGALLLESILMQSPGRISALVDAADSLEPADWSPCCLKRLLWVRCGNIKQALHATDLLLRDGNCQLLALNLQGVSGKKAGTIANTVWHRFHRLLERHPSALLVLSTHPLVEGVKTRVASESAWNLDALDKPRATLLKSLSINVFKRGGGANLGPNPFKNHHSGS